MEKVLASQNRHWESPYPNLYNREVFKRLVRNLEARQIQALQGLRRSGKSTLFRLMINHLSQSIDPKSILYINLDDPFFIPFASDATRFYEMIETAQKLTLTPIRYLFLDEVQAIDGWERFVKSAYDDERFDKIFVTGSNASLLSGELATLLSGRYIATMVYPLSLSELLSINGIDSYLSLVRHSHKALAIVDEMMQYGSFVEVHQSNPSFKRELIASYYDSILLKDCIYNNDIRDTKGFKALSYYLLTNTATLYSYSSLAKALGIHDKSIKEYIAYLEESYLVSEVKHFSYSLATQNNAKKKIYLLDNGFLSLGFRFSPHLGGYFENLVYTELIKAGFEVFFYHESFECDFIARRDGKLHALQVCYELNDQNRKRELTPLSKLPFETQTKTIITYNQSEAIEDIKVVRFYEYFFPHE
ncbi:MAG: ATPase AAA [Sulfuricurvum sp. PC08-66]|nr:MAG: ATPase AAA [Sulfuricurvum sp. PC08-66]